MKERYVNEYTAYPFLRDDASDLKCDFEILTDEISSMIGLLRSLLDDKDKTGDLEEDLSKMNELMYHINPSLRAKVTVTGAELEWLREKTAALWDFVREGLPRNGKAVFVVPQGCAQAACSHVIRAKCKALARLLSRYQQQGNPVDDILFDFVNLYSGYFFCLALGLNKNHGVAELPFVSREYKCEKQR
jgi:cob(I)alamin adenosyltransferase